MSLYSVFYQFEQAKFVNGGLTLSSSPSYPPAASENIACFISGQSGLENNHLGFKYVKLNIYRSIERVIYSSLLY
jgi:hypothetical protein